MDLGNVHGATELSAQSILEILMSPKETLHPSVIARKYPYPPSPGQAQTQCLRSGLSWAVPVNGINYEVTWAWIPPLSLRLRVHVAACLYLTPFHDRVILPYTARPHIINNSVADGRLDCFYLGIFKC